MDITIDNTAKERVWAFIRAVDDEVGGMGYAFLQEDGSLHWSETFLIPQEVSSTEVDFEATNGDQFAIEKAIEDGVLDDENFVWVSWHSHHTMKAYWSGTDDKRIEAMKQAGITRLLSLVGCHDGEYKMRLDMFEVNAHGINIGQVTMSELSFEAEPKKEPSEFEKQIADEIKENVKKKKYGSYHLTKTTPISGTLDEIADKLLTQNGKKKKEDDEPKTKREEAEERRVVYELKEDGGLSFKDAEEMLDTLGIESCEEMLYGAQMVAR